MKKVSQVLLLLCGLSAGALGAPPGPPAGNPIINSTQYQRNSSINIDSATVRQVTLSTFTNAPSLPNGITIAGSLYNSAGTTSNGNPLFPTPYSFGAKGDGITDDTAALQAAIDSAEVLPARTLYIPATTFRCTNTLRITRTITIVGLGALVESNDSDYFQDAGAVNEHFGMGSIIYFDTANTVGLLIRQSPIATYKAQITLDNIFFAGPGQSSGTAGHGIEVDAQDVAFAARCDFKNVAVCNFGGYGIYMKEGYYGSKFEFISTWFNGLTGFYTTGTSQGEWSMMHLRSFGCGYFGLTEADEAGMYIGSGSGISLYRISCSGYLVHAMFSGVSASMTDFQAESFGHTHDTSLRSLIISGSHVDVHGAYFSPNGNFLGKIIDMRTSSYNTLDGLAFFSTVNSTTGYHIYETTPTCAGNSYNYFSSASGIRTLINPQTGVVGRGTELRQEQAIYGNRKRNAVTLDLLRNGGQVQHRWYDSSLALAAVDSRYATGFNVAGSTLVVTSSGTNSSTAFTNAGKISSTDHSVFVCDTMDLDSDSSGSTPMSATVSLSTGVATSSVTVYGVFGGTYTIPNFGALTVKAQARRFSVNGVTRTRMVLSFTDAVSGVAYDLTALLGEIQVSIDAWLPIYE